MALEREVVTGLATRAKRLQAASVVAFACLVTVSACATVPTEPTNPDRIGAGVVVGTGDANGGWRAWAYRTRTGDLCVEVRGTVGGGYTCVRGEDALQSPGIIVTEKGSFVVGGTRAAGAAEARLDDADGSQISATVVAVDPINTGLSIYVLAAPPAGHPQAVTILDDAGAVIESAVVGG